MDRLVLGTTVVGLTSEQVVAQAHIRSILQISDDRLTNCSVDGDIPVTLVLPSVASLLLEDREAGLEGHIVIDEMSEA